MRIRLGCSAESPVRPCLNPGRNFDQVGQGVFRRRHVEIFLCPLNICDKGNNLALSRPKNLNRRFRLSCCQNTLNQFTDRDAFPASYIDGFLYELLI